MYKRKGLITYVDYFYIGDYIKCNGIKKENY